MIKLESFNYNLLIHLFALGAHGYTYVEQRGLSPGSTNVPGSPTNTNDTQRFRVPSTQTGSFLSISSNTIP